MISCYSRSRPISARSSQGAEAGSQSRRQHRDELSRLLDSKGAAYRFIEARAPDEVLKRRLEQREAATHEISDARLENFETLTRFYEPPSEVGTDHCFQVATDQPVTVTIEETLKKLVLAGFKS